jgi:hypothetical protein
VMCYSLLGDGTEFNGGQWERSESHGTETGFNGGLFRGTSCAAVMGCS